MNKIQHSTRNLVDFSWEKVQVDDMVVTCRVLNDVCVLKFGLYMRAA